MNAIHARESLVNAIDALRHAAREKYGSPEKIPEDALKDWTGAALVAAMIYGEDGLAEGLGIPKTFLWLPLRSDFGGDLNRFNRALAVLKDAGFAHVTAELVRADTARMREAAEAERKRNAN